jgi:hypothetical protein
MACETVACRTGRPPVASLGYTPRDATSTVLHQIVREHLETFLATTQHADPNGLPPFLEQEFRAFLDCGVAASGPRASRGFSHAHLERFDLHADRAGLERSCRYLLRLPLAQDRLARLADARVVRTLARPRHDGTRHLNLYPARIPGTLGGHNPATAQKFGPVPWRPGPARAVVSARVRLPSHRRSPGRQRLRFRRRSSRPRHRRYPHPRHRPLPTRRYWRTPCR